MPDPPEPTTGASGATAEAVADGELAEGDDAASRVRAASEARRRGPSNPLAFVPAILVAALSWSPLSSGIDQLRRRAVPFMPDLWETVLATSSAAHGAQRVGAWSRLGFFHPGPLWFYWAAPFYAASGSKPASLALAVAVLVSACLVGTVARVWKTADATAAAVTVAILAIGVHQLGVAGLVAPWNPTVLILPLMLGLVCTADAIERGAVPSMAVAVLCGSFVAQCHLGTFVIGLTVAFVALAGGLRRRRHLTADATIGLDARRWALLAVVAVLPWVPPLVDQAVGSGNLGAIATYFRTGHGPEGSLEGIGANLTPAATIEQLGSIHSLASSEIASWAGITIVAGRDHQPTTLSNAAFGVLIAAGVVGATRRREPRGGGGAPPDAIERGRRLGIQLCRASLGATAMYAISAVRISGQFRPYLLAGAAGAGLALWLGVALVALATARARTRASASIVELATTGVAAVVAIVAIAAAPSHVGGFSSDPEPTDAVAMIAREAHEHGVLFAPDLEQAVPKSLRIAWELERHGVRVGASGPYDAHFSDRHRRFHDPDAIEVSVVTPLHEVPIGCEPVGTYGDATLCIER